MQQKIVVAIIFVAIDRNPCSGSLRLEVAQGVYPGSGLRRVIPYILLAFVIHGGGYLVRGVTMVNEVVTKSFYLRLDALKCSPTSLYIDMEV